MGACDKCVSIFTSHLRLKAAAYARQAERKRLGIRSHSPGYSTAMTEARKYEAQAQALLDVVKELEHVAGT